MCEAQLGYPRPPSRDVCYSEAMTRKEGERARHADAQDRLTYHLIPTLENPSKQQPMHKARSHLKLSLSEQGGTWESSTVTPREARAWSCNHVEPRARETGSRP